MLADFIEALASPLIQPVKPSMCLQGASRRMVAIAEACYANDFGCSLDQLGLCEMITENQRWDSGDSPPTGCVLCQTSRTLHLVALFSDQHFTQGALSYAEPCIP